MFNALLFLKFDSSYTHTQTLLLNSLLATPTTTSSDISPSHVHHLAITTTSNLRLRLGAISYPPKGGISYLTHTTQSSRGRPVYQNSRCSRYRVHFSETFTSDSLLILLCFHRDEILNGKTHDRNSHTFAQYCFVHGVELYVRNSLSLAVVIVFDESSG